MGSFHLLLLFNTAPKMFERHGFVTFVLVAGFYFRSYQGKVFLVKTGEKRESGQEERHQNYSTNTELAKEMELDLNHFTIPKGSVTMFPTIRSSSFTTRRTTSRTTRITTRRTTRRTIKRTIKRTMRRTTSCECGKPSIHRPAPETDPLDPEISGGFYTMPREYPWTVRLVGGCVRGLCGGALVSPKIVLTAFHCTVTIGDRWATKPCDHSDGKRMAILGANTINMYDVKYNPSKYNMIPVVEARNPPNAPFMSWTLKSHDFAMLVLKYPAKYDEYVRPICLPYPGAEYGNRVAIAAGWGRTGHNSGHTSPKLKAVYLKVNPKQYEHRYIFGTFTVKKDNKWQDPCGGDSGGPLMIRKASSDRFVLIGTLNGQGYICKRDFVSHFEDTTDGTWNKVSAHMGWIERNMNELGQKVCKL